MDVETKLVSVTVNGKAIQVPAGTSVIEAAESAGVFIPRYCYHPDLSIAGVCRMCVVEVEKQPKLQISCNTIVSEGMAVTTNSAKVKDAVKAALELHLINHPLDCPICDKAGECKLQDFYADFGLYKSRMEWDNKVHKPKVVDIGPIVLDEERCILCTRCVRFTAEVTKTFELGIFNRGDRSQLKTYDDGPLRNEYTGNLADICPVGALTAKDFRFTQRVWFLDKTETVCTLCSRGCNTSTSMNPHTKKLFRIEPRRNPQVNRSWICDEGRWKYHYVYSEKRLEVPQENVDGMREERTWMAAFGWMHETLRTGAGNILVGLSTQLCNEEMVDLIATLRTMGVGDFTWLVDESVVEDRKPYDGILKHRDRTPNANGFITVAKLLGIEPLPLSKALSDLSTGRFESVWLLGLESESIPWIEPLFRDAPAKTTILYHGTSELPCLARAKWVLPNVSAYEKSGTYISALDHFQRGRRTIDPQFVSRDGHAIAFGVERGNDRERVSATRMESIYDEVVAPKILKIPDLKWRKVPAKGL